MRNCNGTHTHTQRADTALYLFIGLYRWHSGVFTLVRYLTGKQIHMNTMCYKNESKNIFRFYHQFGSHTSFHFRVIYI